MRSAWIFGSLGLLLFAAGCNCGSCGWGNCGRGYPAGYQQAAAPNAQYNMAGTYASTPTGQPQTTVAPAGGLSEVPGAVTDSGGSAVVPATARSTSLSSDNPTLE